MTASALTRGIVAIGAAAGIVAAIASPASAESPGQMPLGFAGPLTGDAAAFGRSTLKAVEIAVRELNAAGGLGAAGGLIGTTVKLVVGDDRCDAGMASSVAKRHVEQDKISYVIGPSCPAVAMDAGPIYAKAGVIQFVPTVTAVELTQRFPDNIARMVANDGQEAQAIASHLARDHKGKKLTIVHGNLFYRRTIAELVGAALSSEQKALARFEPLSDVVGLYERLADKLQRDPPDVIYLALDSEQVVPFVGKLRQRGVKSRLIGGQHLLSQGFWHIARGTAEGIDVIAPIDALGNPNFGKAVDLLRQADVIPDIVTLSNFAAVQTWAQAVQRADGDPKKVIAALRSGVFETAVGRVAFDQKGDRRDIQYTVLTWQGGRMVPVK